MADMEARTEEMASAVLDTRIGPAWLEGVAEVVTTAFGVFDALTTPAWTLATVRPMARRERSCILRY